MAFDQSTNNLFFIADWHILGSAPDPGEFVVWEYDRNDGTIRFWAYDLEATYDANHPTQGSPFEFENTGGLSGALITKLEGITTDPTLFFCDSSGNKVTFEHITSFPYMEVVLVPASGEGQACEIMVCDTIITTPITVTADSGTSDGTAIVSANSIKTLEISLSEFGPWVPMTGPAPNWTHTFTGLSEGEYTAWVRQSSNTSCKKSSGFEIFPEDAYNPRWQITNFTTYNGEVCSFFIDERNYMGSAVDVCASPNVLNVQWAQIDDDEFSPVKPSTANVQFTSETNFQFLDLFTADQFKFRGRLIVDGSLNWVGYVVADQYGEPYKAPPYQVSINLTDGLAILDTIEFKNIDGELFNGRKSVLEAIKIGLDKLNYQINIRTAVNTYEANMDQLITDDPLLQTYINPESYTIDELEKTAESFLTVIKEVLKPFASHLKMESGEWVIVETVEQKESYNRRLYDFELSQISTDTFDPVVSHTSGTASPMIRCVGGAAYLQMIPAFGKLTVVEDFGTNVNLIKGSEFDLEQWDGDTNIYWGGTNYLRELIDAQSGKYGLRIDGNSGSPASSLFTQYNFDININPAHDLFLNIKIVSKVEIGDFDEIAFGDDVQISYAISVLNDPLNDYHLRTIDVPTGDGELLAFAEDGLEVPYVLAKAKKINEYWEYNKNVALSNLNIDQGKLQVKLYQGISSIYDIDNITYDTVQVNIIVREDPLKPNQYTAVPKDQDRVYINQGFNVIEDRQIMHGDGKLIDNRNASMKNVFSLLDGTSTSEWNRFGVAESRELIDLYLARIMSQRIIGKQNVTMDLILKLSAVFTMNNVLSDSGKIFAVNSMLWNVKKSIKSLDLIEIDEGDIDEVITEFAMQYPDLEIMLYPDGTIMSYE